MSINKYFFIVLLECSHKVSVYTTNTICNVFLSNCSLGPSAVQKVQVKRYTNTLGVYWQPGLGRTDAFQIVLRETMSLISNVTLDNATTSYQLTGLTPGRHYNFSIISEVAGFTNSVSMQAQTGTIQYLVKYTAV